MCEAFSAIVLESGKVLWEMGIDAHDELLRLNDTKDDTLPPQFARIEISPNTWRLHGGPDAKILWEGKLER